METTRPVIYYEYEQKEPGQPAEKVEKGTATFHQWGMDYNEFETGPGSFSTAIIELGDGTVKNVDCEMIRFVDAKHPHDVLTKDFAEGADNDADDVVLSDQKRHDIVSLLSEKRLQCRLIDATNTNNNIIFIINTLDFRTEEITFPNAFVKNRSAEEIVREIMCQMGRKYS